MMQKAAIACSICRAAASCRWMIFREAPQICRAYTPLVFSLERSLNSARLPQARGIFVCASGSAPWCSEKTWRAASAASPLGTSDAGAASTGARIIITGMDANRTIMGTTANAEGAKHPPTVDIFTPVIKTATRLRRSTAKLFLERIKHGNVYSRGNYRHRRRVYHIPSFCKTFLRLRQ